MAAPTPRAVLGTASATSDSTSFTPTLPTHDVGDTLFAFVASDGSGATLSCAGWELLASWNSTTSKGHIFRRSTVAASSSESNPTFTSTASEQFAANMMSVPGSALLNLQAAGSSGSSGTPDAPNLNISGGPVDPLLVVFYAFDGPAGISAAPSGYSGALATNNGGAQCCASITAYKTATGVNSENPGTATTSNEQWAAMTVAIFETPAPPPPPEFAASSSRFALLGVG